MVAINIEKPNDCKKCPLMGTDGDPRDYFSPMMCIAIYATTHEIKHCIGGKVRGDCPLVEIGICKDCIHRDPEDKKCDCGHAILWQLPREDDWYCKDFERKITRMEK